MNFQKLILLLSEFWGERGCLIEQPWDLEVGAGTMHPATFLRVLGPEPWKVGYVQPSRRPADGRYGDNPFRLGKHYQFQVILKPSPADIQDLYLESLRRLGIRPEEHDIRFEEDNWESPTLGAWGVGWQVMCDGMEITQFTYFQQAGGIDLAPMAGEITYGLERLAMFLGARNSVYEVPWGPDYSYGDVRQYEEREWSKYYFETADVAGTLKMLEFAEGEANRCLEAGLVFPAYDWTLRCSHAFNTLDARGAVSATERVAMIKRVRVLAVACAQAYVRSREEAGWPMLDRSEWGRAKKAELLAAREAAAAAGGAK